MMQWHESTQGRPANSRAKRNLRASATVALTAVVVTLPEPGIATTRPHATSHSSAQQKRIPDLRDFPDPWVSAASVLRAAQPFEI
jgi:hypothetical protein